MNIADDYLERLDDGILSKILASIQDELDRRSWRLVCKRFLQLEAGSRSKIRLLRVELLGQVLQKFGNLQDLDLSLCSKITDRDVTAVTRYCATRLLAINLSRQVWVSNIGLALLASQCRTLVTLDLSGCQNVGDLGLVAIAQAQHLQTLKLGGCFLITNDGLRCITMGCNKLSILVLKGCKQITDLGMNLLATHSKSLKKLDLSFTQVSDKGLEYVARIESLTTLNLKACRKIGDNGLLHLAKAATHLLELDVSRSTTAANVTVIGISALIGRRTSQEFGFRVLRLDGCQVSENVLQLVSSGCKHLVELSLSKCSGVTDAGLTQVVTSCSCLRRLDITCCRELTSVAVFSIVRSCQSLCSLSAEACDIFTPDNLLWLAQRCCNLEQLDLTDCNITDAGLKSISIGQRLLKVLKLGVCSNITNTGLGYIGGNCTELTELDLYRCNKIGDAGVDAIAKGCSKLKLLNLSYCDRISDKSLSRVLSNLKELCHLEIRACCLITFAKISRSSERLLELDIKHCKRVQDAGMMAIVDSCSNLRQINLSYTSVTSSGLVALSKLSCMQDMKLLGFGLSSAESIATMLRQSQSVKKIKLSTQLKNAIPEQLVDSVRNRGCVFRWMDKPLQR